jgi:hypothetical protein
MEFLLIMGIGTLIAVWAVVRTRPKRLIHFGRPSSPNDQFTPSGTPAWKKNAQPMSELEYLAMIERYQNDPVHYPFPLPPPVHRES